MSISREEFKKQIRARREAKEGKFARLRLVAEKYPRHVSAAIIELANGFHEVGEGLHAFNDNLGQVSPPKTASLTVRAEAAKHFAANFRLLAEENPEEMGVALNDVYGAINDLAGNIEALAQNMGVELVAPEEIGGDEHVPAESPEEELAEGHETLEGPQFIEEELEEAEEAVGAGDMEEAAQEAHDAESAALDETHEEPVEACMASEEVTAGSEAWVTDRDETGKPREPKAAFLRKRK